MLFNECRAFIFDMDGVLVDSENLYKILEKELFEEVGVTISPEEHFSYQGCSNPVMWSRIIERHRLSDSLDELVQLTENKVIKYFSSLPEIHPMPGVIQLLNFLKSRGIKLALASSSTIDVIRIVLAKSGLDKHFSIIADCTEAGAGKPDPAIFVLARKKLDLPEDQCVVIEDSTNGIKAALAAGMYCVAFNGPGSEHQDQSAAHLVIRNFSEIIYHFTNCK